jgi:hypothetical protein
VKKTILIIAIVLAAYIPAWGGDCKLDLDAASAAICNQEYVSGVKICRDTHPSPLDYDNLAACIGYSRDVYNKCTGGCYGSGTNAMGSYAE